MHNWTIVVLAGAVFLWGVFAQRLERTVVTAAMFFLTVGLVFGPEGTGWVTLDVGGHELQIVAEITLTLVLFTDASRLDLRTLRRDYPLPARLLGIGLPLTIGLGALVAKALFSELTWLEAGLVGVILAPTDAALGQAVVSDPRLRVAVQSGPECGERAQRRHLCAAPVHPARCYQRRRRRHQCGRSRPSRVRADRLRAARRGGCRWCGFGGDGMGRPPWLHVAGMETGRHIGHSCRLLWVGRSAQWGRIRCRVRGSPAVRLAHPKDVRSMTELIVDGGELFEA